MNTKASDLFGIEIDSVKSLSDLMRVYKRAKRGMNAEKAKLLLECLIVADIGSDDKTRKLGLVPEIEKMVVDLDEEAQFQIAGRLAALLPNMMLQGDMTHYCDQMTTVDLYMLLKGIDQSLGSNAGTDISTRMVEAAARAFSFHCNSVSTGQLIPNQNGMIPVANIVYKYPDEIIRLTDMLSQHIFKNKYKTEQVVQIINKDTGKGKVLDVLLDTAEENGNRIEKTFDYFDLCVFEAICSFLKDSPGYDYVENVIDLDSIMKLMKFNKNARSGSDKNLIHEIWHSITKLLNNQLEISDKGQVMFSGLMLDGIVTDVNGKLCLKLNSIPGLWEYIMNNSMYESIEMDKLQIPISFTKYTIPIFRYLSQRVREIFQSTLIPGNGTCLKPKKGMENKIILKNVFEKVFDTSITDYNRKRRIKDTVIKILDEMINLRMITRYKVEGKLSDCVIHLFRD